MINKSDSRCAVVRFCYHSYDYRPNWTPLSPITITNCCLSRKPAKYSYKQGQVHVFPESTFFFPSTASVNECIMINNRTRRSNYSPISHSGTRFSSEEAQLSSGEAKLYRLSSCMRGLHKSKLWSMQTTWGSVVYYALSN